MPRSFDEEYHGPLSETEYPLPEEETFPADERMPAEERMPVEYEISRDESNAASAGPEPDPEEKRRARLKKYFLKPLTALIAASGILFAAIGFDPLGAKPALTPVTPVTPSGKPLAPDPNADDAFPVLTDLDPDDGTHITGGDCQIYLYLAEPKTFTVTFFASSTVQETMGEYAGFVSSGWNVQKQSATSDGSAVYDAASNTLTLTDFNDPNAQINANMMGNGLKIRLVGENRVGQILVWGWGYAGSLTLTGTGSLTVNEYYENKVGVFLKAENNVTPGADTGAPTAANCTSCLMVDGTVDFVEIYGTQTAFAVDGHSKAEKGLYYLHPLHLYGGTQGLYRDENGSSLGVYSIFGPDGGFATHVLFSATQPGMEHADDPDHYPSFTPHAPNESVTIWYWSNANSWSQGPVLLADGETMVNDNYRGLGVSKTYRNGVQNDHYLVVDGVALVRGSACASDVPALGTVPGASYRQDETGMSRLTLTNFKGGSLKMRLMGTVFIELVGENELDEIEILGYFSGGTIFFVGDGSLTVNASRTHSKGILIDAQFGSFRMLVQPGVTLDVYGGPTVSDSIGDDINAAILVKASMLTDGIVYFPETVLTGGTRMLGAYEYDYDLVPTNPTSEIIDATSQFHDTTVVDENGRPSLHVTFSPADPA